MSPDGTYNGYANYQTWNVCLWISNDEGLYNIAKSTESYKDFVDTIRRMGEVVGNDTKYGSIGYETPDGVAWNDSGVNLPEMQEYWEENFSNVGT